MFVLLSREGIVSKKKGVDRSRVQAVNVVNGSGTVLSKVWTVYKNVFMAFAVESTRTLSAFSDMVVKKMMFW